MNISDASSRDSVHDVIFNQRRYTWRRALMRDLLLRPIGFGLLIRIRVEGREHIPPTGPTLVIMNHIASIDPFVVTGVIRPRFLVPMSKIENYANPFVRFMSNMWGVFPVRRGEVDRKALNSTITLLNQGLPVLIAPEGTRQPALQHAKDGMAYVATKANAAILPVGLEGTDQFPGAYKRGRRPQVQVKIGRAFRLRTEGQARIPRDVLTQMTHEAMYQLAALIPEHRRGDYADLENATTDLLSFLE